MSTRPETLAFLLDQIGALPNVRTRRMFGEYCVYLDDKPTAFVCDDRLFVKITEAGRSLLADPALGQPYPGAKPYFLLQPDEWENRDELCRLLAATADALPAPKPKTARRDGPANDPRRKPRGPS
jgi:TfoX/Sxy family transcriptional regulator of competence genes